MHFHLQCIQNMLIKGHSNFCKIVNTYRICVVITFKRLTDWQRPWTVYVVRSKFVLICGQLLTRKTEISVSGIGVISAGFICEESINASFSQYHHYLKSRFGDIVGFRHSLAGANGVAVGSSLARPRHRWWKVPVKIGWKNFHRWRHYPKLVKTL